jgi:pimeloyl-ACP methyl ester carboxylesterase
MKTLVLLLALIGCAADKETPAMTKTTMTTTAAVKSGHAKANGVNYYYEIRGQGAPLLLLHGGLGTIEMFEPILPELTKNRTVIAVDLHGHGRTPLGERTNLSMLDQGDDLAAVLEQLGFKQVDVLGFSMGAGVAFRLAVQHPERVRRLVLVSMGFARDGFYPEMLPQQSQVSGAIAPMMKETPMYKIYAQVAPNVDEFPKLLDAVGEAMRAPQDWRDDVKKLTMPTMLIFGDSDMFRLEHVVEFYKLLGGGQRDAGWQREHMATNRLAILPGVTHYEMLDSAALVPTALPFLDAK